jgi:nucleoside-diphosphate-sugar epimerase
MAATDDLIVVTGSSGLIGTALIRRLADDFRIVGFDRVGPPHPPPHAECVGIDLTSDESVCEGLERVRYAYGRRIASVVHLAAHYDFSGEPSPLYEQITIQGTQRLLSALRDFDVGQFIFSSTMLVHAPCQPSERIDEDWPIDPKWDYPESKARTESMLLEEHGPVPLVMLRIAGVYTDRCQSIPLAHQVQRIYERKMIARVFPGDVTHGQAFVHLDDVVEALKLCVARRVQLPSEAVMLIGEDRTLSYDELQRAFSRLIHHEQWETTQIPKALAKTGAWLQDVMPGEDPFIKPWMIDLADDHYALDISRARQWLGWQPKWSLNETIPTMVAHLKADPPGFYRDNKLKPPGWLEEEAGTLTEAEATHGR